MDPFTAWFAPVLTAFAGAVLTWILIRGKQISDKAQRNSPGYSARRERFYRRSFEASPVGQAILTPQGQWVKANERLRKLLGYTREELVSKTIRDLTHSDDRKVESMHIRRLMRHEIASYSIGKRLLCKDGNYRRFEVSLARFEEESDGRELWECVMIPLVSGMPDTTIEHSLKLGDLLQPITDLAYVRFDDQGLIENWNDGATRIFGFRKDEIVGRSRTTLYREADVWEQKPRQDLKDAIAKGRLEKDDVRVGRDGVEIRLRVTIIPDVRQDDIVGFIELSREIDEQRGVDQYRQSYERLKRISEERISILQGELEDAKREAGRETTRREAELSSELAGVRREAEKQLAELKILTDAFRKEIDRRRVLEDALMEAQAEREQMGHRIVELEEHPAVEQEVVELTETSTANWLTFEQQPPRDLILTLSRGEKTGTLRIESNSMTKRIFFDKGRIYSCTSNDPSMLLGELLLREGTISREDHEKAIGVHHESGIALGRILVIMGALDTKGLENAMTRKAELELINLLTWTEGRFEFIPGQPGSEQLVPVSLDPAPIIARSAPDETALRIEPEMVGNETVPVATLVPADMSPEVVIEIPEGDGTVLAWRSPEDTGPALRASEPAEQARKKRKRRKRKERVEEPPAEPGDGFVASKSKRSTKFHRADCLAAKKIGTRSRIEIASRDEAIARGLEPCRMCLE